MQTIDSFQDTKVYVLSTAKINVAAEGVFQQGAENVYSQSIVISNYDYLLWFLNTASHLMVTRS